MLFTVRLLTFYVSDPIFIGEARQLSPDQPTSNVFSDSFRSCQSNQVVKMSQPVLLAPVLRLR